MKIIRVVSVLSVILLIGSGCATGTVRPVFTAAPPAATVQTPAPTETAAVVAPALTEAATASPSPPAMDSPTPSTVPTIYLFTENNFTDFFHFGMSRKAIKKELKQMHVENIDEYSLDEPILPIIFPAGFWMIEAGNADFTLTFLFNSDDQLYSISSTGATAKGFCCGDSLDKMHQLYGQEDEFNATYGGYIYDKKDYYFSIDFDFYDYEHESAGWSVFWDIWNEPISSKPPVGIKRPGSDEIIKFNELTLKDYFQFDMSRDSVEKKLKDLGIRIVNENDMEIDTDHVCFGFDAGLSSISVSHWETSKGLKYGDLKATLFDLYGTGYEFGDNYEGEETDYIYHMNGYDLSVNMNDWGYDRVFSVDNWTVCPRK